MVNKRILRFLMLFFACLTPLIIMDWFDHKALGLALGLALVAVWGRARFWLIVGLFLVYCGILPAFISFSISELIVGVISGYGVLGLVWVLLQVFEGDLQLVLSEVGRVVFVGLSLLWALPLVIALVTGGGGEPEWKIPFEPVWPDLSGVFFFIVFPLGVGLPAGMWLARITRGQILVLGSLAFLALYPLVGRLPFFDEYFVALLASCAANALLGNALANRFSPRIIAAARLAGASWPDLIVRLYLPLIGRRLPLFLALIFVYAFKFSSIETSEEILWAYFFRLIIFGGVILYFVRHLFRLSLVQDLKKNQGME